MSWDDTKTDSVDKVFAADWNAMTADQKARAGTSSSTFQIDDDDTGPKLKNVAGELQARNAADGAYADFRALSLYGDGSNLTGVGSAAASSLTGTVYNNTGVTLPKGVVIYITGSSGTIPYVAKASCTDSAKIRILGITAQSIADSTSGLVRIFGVLTNIDTLGTTDANPNGETWTAGNLLWLDDSNGGMTNVRPTSGRSIKCAYSIKGSSDTDILLVIARENEVWNTCAAGEDVVFRVGDNDGANKVSIRDYANNEVASIDSNGLLVTPSVPLKKLDATVAPTANEDSGDGYAVGSTWMDVTADKAYVCLDSSDGVAVWTEITASAGSGGDITTDDAWAAAGDLIVGTGVDTAGILSVSAPAATILNALAVANTETTPTWQSLMDATTPPMDSTASAGTAVTLARIDHVHPVDTSRAPANPLATDSLWTAAGQTVVSTGSGTAHVILNKLDGTAAPAVTDDSGEGYAAGSIWVDVTNYKSYICQDATSTAAVWTDITATGVDGGTL